MILVKHARRPAAATLLFLMLVCATACNGSSQTPNRAAGNATGGTLVVACTISTLCSLVADVGGPDIDLHGVVPVGASPETYEPTPSDVVAVSHAEVLFENGLGLEVWLDKLLTSAAEPHVVRVRLSDAVPAAERPTGNPHLWMDPIYAEAYVSDIASALERTDPTHASGYATRAAKERTRLTALDTWIRTQIATIPPDHRAMLCFHDAWYYFDRRYGIENVGAIKPYPGQDPPPGYFAHLITLARTHHVRAVFGEPQFSPKLALTLQSEAGIAVFTNLYDDTLGTTADLSDYEAMMRYDVATIVAALRR